jgi:hypothetical protein
VPRRVHVHHLVLMLMDQGPGSALCAPADPALARGHLRTMPPLVSRALSPMSFTVTPCHKPPAPPTGLGRGREALPVETNKLNFHCASFLASLAPWLAHALTLPQSSPLHGTMALFRPGTPRYQ